MVAKFSYSGGSEVDPAKMARELSRVTSFAQAVGNIQSEDDILFPNPIAAWNAYEKGLWDGKNAIKTAIAFRLIEPEASNSISNDKALEYICKQAEEDLETKQLTRASVHEESNGEVVKEESNEPDHKKQKEIIAKIRGSRRTPKAGPNPSAPPRTIIDARSGKVVQLGQYRDVPSNFGSESSVESDAQRGQPIGHGGTNQDEESNGETDSKNIDGKPILTKSKDTQTNKPIEVVLKPELTLDKYEPQTKEASIESILSLDQQIAELQRQKMERIKVKLDQICDFIEKLDDLDGLRRINDTVSRVLSLKIAPKEINNG